MPRYVTNDDLRQLVRDLVGYDSTQKAIAARFGISQTYLSDFLSGRKDAGAKILDALGYDPTPFYRRKSVQK